MTDSKWELWIATIYPHFAGSHDPTIILHHLKEVVKEIGPSLVAIGECGLDYSAKNTVSWEKQLELFRGHIRLAMELKFPLVLHIREAEEDGRAVLREERLPRRWQIHRHCFKGLSLT